MLGLASVILGSRLGRVLAGGLAVAIIIGLAWWWADHRAYRRGWDAALAAVAQQDARAAATADKVRSKVDACFDQGRSWDVVENRCR